MNGYADLHLHTIASDGTQTIDELARRARECALRTIAITDHDVISDELTGRISERNGVEIITGVEVKATFESVAGEILGYFVDPGAPKLRELLDRLKTSRIDRMRWMVDLCREEIGVSISFDDVREVAAGNLGRPHLARILIDRGVVGTFSDAFSEWLGKGRPCYWPIDKPPYPDVLEAIHDAGGVASLAHPCLMEVEDWPGLLDELSRAGLDAIEVFYPYIASDDASRGRSIEPRVMKNGAELRGFLLTGGSDDHGRDSTKESLGEIRVPYERVEALRAALPIPL